MKPYLLILSAFVFPVLAAHLAFVAAVSPKLVKLVS